ncbi:MAG TPA: selenoneine synthase SenA [Gemmataceae bacterium]|jgi:iron(II)-dependent oxidoreductase|nr:selenoneine synthase SenA [Gemmataceae bacterium]
MVHPEGAREKGLLPMLPRAELIDWVRDARQRTCDLVADLSDAQLIGPQLPTLNPLLWEIGHVAWFQEKWVLRRCSSSAAMRDADALYDSAAVAHNTRWDLRLPGRHETLRYMEEVRDRVVERLQQKEMTQEDIYFTLLTVFHEDMHTEAFTYTRQTLEYGAPRFPVVATGTGTGTGTGRGLDDAFIPGGVFELGAMRDEGFVFDNEKWAHAVEIQPFAMARTPVTQAEFAAFVDDDGYGHERWWSKEGWRWRQQAGAQHPVYWRREAGRWQRRHFDRWTPLETHHAMVHVNWYEADAFCRWAGRRLPTESEWEAAAAAAPSSSGSELGRSKRRFPWGTEPPTGRQANVDWGGMGCVDVDCLPEGDSAFGCRQMIGNVWEWTADDFLPYPGFVADPYKEYSAPWFGTHKVLRGGCWATRARLLRNTWRNFYRPERRDVWAGFRTCALRP